MKAQRQDNDVRDLVIAARSGDRDALERLLVAHLPYLRRLCLRISGGDEQVTADALQEVALALLDRFESLKDAGAFRSWVSTIAVNACRMEMRRRNRWWKRFTSYDVQPQIFEDKVQDIRDNAESQTIKEETGQHIWKLLKKLPDDQRVVFVLCDIEKFAYAEVAEILGGNAESIRSRVRRARGAVGRLVAKDEVMREMLDE